VSLADPGSSAGADLTFDEVTTPGATTFAVVGTAPPVPPDFQIGDPPVFYDISTTASFTSVEVCIRYDETSIGVPETDLALLHHASGSGTWVNVTTSVNYDDNVICGTVTSLSPFAIARPTTVGVGDGPLPARVAFGLAHPNPSQGVTRFTLALPRELAVRVRIHDAAGRVVRTLARGQAMPPGTHTLVWAGDDDAGRRVPSGVYFASGRAGDVTFERRVVRLR
jgi:hypothetical protein